MAELKKDTFEVYYKQYYTQIYGYILKKVINIQIAEDLTMDVFYAVWNKFESFDESKASFQTWLYVIVNNRLKNYYRDRKENVEWDDAFVGAEDNTDEVAEAAQIQFLRDKLYDALEELNDVQRQIVICKYFKNMNASEIALETGLAPGNVRVHLKRAMDKIKDYFDRNNIRWE